MVGICLGRYGGPSGAAVSCERGTPVGPLGSLNSRHRRTLESVLQNGPVSFRVTCRAHSEHRFELKVPSSSPSVSGVEPVVLDCRSTHPKVVVGDQSSP